MQNFYTYNEFNELKSNCVTPTLFESLGMSKDTQKVIIKPNISSPDEETKKCPACNETINLEAKKCRFCGEMFDPEEVMRLIEERRAESEKEKAASGKQKCPICGNWNTYYDVYDNLFCPDCKKIRL